MLFKRRWTLAMMFAAALLLGAPLTASAQANGCAIDYNGDGIGSNIDFAIFLPLWQSGSSAADLNGDLAVDIFDVNTFIAYFGFTPCPWRADFQYNRSIDPVDQIFFQFLYANGSLRADMDGDSLLTAADLAAFAAVFATTY